MRRSFGDRPKVSWLIRRVPVLDRSFRGEGKGATLFLEGLVKYTEGSSRRRWLLGEAGQQQIPPLRSGMTSKKAKAEAKAQYRDSEPESAQKDGP